MRTILIIVKMGLLALGIEQGLNRPFQTLFVLRKLRLTIQEGNLIQGWGKPGNFRNSGSAQTKSFSPPYLSEVGRGGKTGMFCGKGSPTLYSSIWSGQFPFNLTLFSLTSFPPIPLLRG